MAAGTAAGVGAGRAVEITFETFERVLWPLMLGRGVPSAEDAKAPLAETHPSKDLLDKVRRAPVKASLVFREIVSYIKGSSLALDAEGGRLSRAAYLALGKKMAPSFEKVDRGGGAAGSGGGSGSGAGGGGDGDGAFSGAGGVGREYVYELYLKYEAWKEAFGAYDVLDACFHIYRGLRAGGYRGPPLDEIYVDEVQDFTQAELRLFLEVARDKNRLFFTGDTCQTIARGVGFRFEDLKSMFYELGEQQRLELSRRGLRAEDVAKQTLVRVPKVNQLSVNYRTHVRGARGRTRAACFALPGAAASLPRPPPCATGRASLAPPPLLRSQGDGVCALLAVAERHPRRGIADRAAPARALSAQRRRAREGRRPL